MPSPAISTSTASAAASTLVAGRRLGFGVAMPASLHQHGHRVFDIGLEGSKQLGAERAVDDAVIHREGYAHHRCDLERVVLDDRAFLAAADGKYRRLWRGDHRAKTGDAVHAEI